MLFKLSDKFIEEYKCIQPEWGYGDLSYFVYKIHYARRKEDNTQEEFWETLQRVVEGIFSIQKKHCLNMGLPWDGHKAQRSAQKMFEKMWQFKFLPPGRGLWLCGTSVVDKIGSAGLNNCAFRSTKDIRRDFGRPFAWVCDMLMLGVGVGFDTRGASTLLVKKPIGGTELYKIPDTREGWVESIQKLIDSYDGRERNSIVFDYSLLRPAGAPIKTFGGTASGPEPLKKGHEDIRKVLDLLDEKEITSVAIVDIMNLIGKFVVAGNTRRSAQIALGSIDDIDFITMKDPISHPEELLHHRWASNNSVIAASDSDFSQIVKHIIKNGEPGLFFLDNAKYHGRFKDGYYDINDSRADSRILGVNPCSEQLLEDAEICNLVETFPANHSSVEEYYETLKYAYLYAKSVTLVPTHCPETNQVMLQNRRIGLSMSGVQQALKKFGSAKFFNDFCDKGYEIVRHWDRIYSRWLGIPTSIRVTTLKPSGTVSLLSGATPGVHCTHSEHYLRSVRISPFSPLLDKLIKAGYRISFSDSNRDLIKKVQIELGQNWEIFPDQPIPSQDKNFLKKFGEYGGNLVIYFPIKEENFTKSKNDISLWEQLCLVRELQDKWSDNAVSCTVTFKKEEIKDLKSSIEFFAPYVKTLSFLPLDEHGYSQPPYQSITEEEFNEYSRSLKSLNFSSVKGETESGEKYCTNDTCLI